MRIHRIGPCTTESFKGKLKTNYGMCHYRECGLPPSWFDCVYALRSISVVSQGDKHA